MKIFNIKNRFFSKLGSAATKYPDDDDEDDGWLDKPSVEVFPPEDYLDVSPNVDISSQCLAAALSEEPSGNLSNLTAQPNLCSEEALGEDNDFLMDL